MSARRKFVIRPGVKALGMDETKAKDTLERIRAAIRMIHDQNASTLSFEELYRFSYNLVLYKHAKLLYEMVQHEIRTHLEERVRDVILHAADEQLLSAIQSEWARHQVSTKMIRDIMMYLDRIYTIPNHRHPVYDMGVLEFCNVVIRHQNVRSRLRELLQREVAKDRAGQMVDRDALRQTLSMLVALGVNSNSVYEIEFEEAFLRNTANFYIAESAEYIGQNTCADFLRKASERIREENERQVAYLAQSTAPKLRRLMETHFIADHVMALMEMDSGAIALMDEQKTDDLRLMYDLFRMVMTSVSWEAQVPERPDPRSVDAGTGAIVSYRVERRKDPPLAILRYMMQWHIESTGYSIVQDTEQSKDPVRFVERLLGLQAQYATIIGSAFDQDRNFLWAMKSAFESFMNVGPRCAQFLAMYLDMQMRSGFKSDSIEEIRSKLDAVVVAFRYVEDKDVFENFYKQYLQRRLLSGRSVSDEAEQLMIVRLKTECGTMFTSRLEGMFNDLRVSKEVMQAFRKQMEPALEGPELSVTVLTTVNWQGSGESSGRIPNALRPSVEQFERWYLERFNGRILQWQLMHGTADLKMLYLPRSYELVVTTYQMMILLLFEEKDCDAATFAEIREETGIEEAELKRQLISLTTPAARVLLKQHKSRQVGETEEFRLNYEYRSPKLKNRVRLVTMKSAKASEEVTRSTAVPEHVEAARKNMIDAAIVRIMKARRTLEHSQLIAETHRLLQTRFHPQPADIKRRIESLIERDYLERGEENNRVYQYVA